LKAFEVTVHRILRELLTSDQGVLFQWALNLRISAKLVEECYAVTLTIVVTRLTGRLHAMEGGFEAVIGPEHKQVSHVTDWHRSAI
jgi:hypothetical protein